MRNLFGLILGAILLQGCPSKTNTLVPLNNSVQAAPPTLVSVKITNYQPQPGNTYQNIFVSNFSVSLSNGSLQYSTARDGLNDVTKMAAAQNFGFTVGNPESVVPGFQDLILYQTGITSAQQVSLQCQPSLTGVTTQDAFIYNDSRLSGASVTLGLRDCDKAYLNLNPKTFDFNGNGIPDYLELRCGMNPSNKIQSSLSTTSDNMTNMEKCRRGIPIAESSTTDANQLYAYVYTNTTNSDNSLNFSVTNIPVLNNAQDNFIAIYIVEVNNATKALTLSSAFAILTNGYVNKTLVVPYWGTSPTTLTNQQIPVPVVPSTP
jgi:hypothetical protein